MGMIRSLAISTLLVIGLGAGACSHWKPYDYEANRSSESSVEREARREREARGEQQRIVRCETMGQAARRDAPDCRI